MSAGHAGGAALAARGASILGYAWRTPLGATVDGALSRLLAGERAARVNDRFPVDTYACRLAAPIDGVPEASPHGRFLDRMGLFGVEVAREALAMAAARGSTGRDERLGLFCGVGGLRVRWNELLPALAGQRPSGEEAWARGFRRLHPFWMLRHLSNNAHALISVEVRALGEGATFGGAVAGVEAIAAAARALADGAVDRALVVAYDSLIEPEILVELGARGAASHEPLDRLRAPYDARASGVVPGEAAAALVLGRDTIGAMGWIAAATGADGSEGEPAASHLAAIVRRLVAEHGPIALIDGAARALPAHDQAERASVARVVGPTEPLIAVAAAMGALGATAAPVRAIALAEVLRRGVLPRIAGLERAAEGPLRPVVAAEGSRAHAAIGLVAGAAGLAGAVRVEVDR